MKTHSLLPLIALALLAAITRPASAVTFNMSPLYDEQVFSLNAVDGIAPGSTPYPAFTANVAAAHGSQTGGVVNFDEIQTFTFTAFDAVVGVSVYHVATYNSAAFGIGGGPGNWFTGNVGPVPISGQPNNPPFTGTQFLSTTGANPLYFNFDFDALNTGTRVQAAGLTVLGSPLLSTIDFYAFNAAGAQLAHLTDVVGNAANDDTFFGFDSGVSDIRYVTVVGTTDFKIDDLAFHGAVPEPGTCALLLAAAAFPWRLRRKVGALATAVMLAVVATPESRAVTAYGIDGVGDLRLITNLNTMSSVILGPTGFTGPVNVGLAIDPFGQLYAGDGLGNLYSLAPNGAPTLLGNWGLGAITGLDWDPISNDLLVLSASGVGHQLSHANPGNGAQQGPIVTALIASNDQAEGIAMLSSTIGLITFLNATSTSVQMINLNTGALLGTAATSTPGDNWTGVDVDPATNTAYMIGWIDDSWQVGPGLTATHLGNTAHLDWTAFAIPAPEPTSTMLLAGGLLVAVSRRQRRAA